MGNVRFQECVELLVSAGAAVDVQTSRGKTALHYSAADGRLAAVAALLAAGCRTDLLDEKVL